MRTAMAAFAAALMVAGSAHGQHGGGFDPVTGRDFFGKTLDQYIDARIPKAAPIAPKFQDDWNPFGRSSPRVIQPVYRTAPQPAPSQSGNLMFGLGIGAALAVAYFLGKRSEQKDAETKPGGNPPGSDLS